MPANENGWSLCAECNNAIGGCSWSESFEPVKGWKAKRVDDTYSIIECPLYVPDNGEPIKPHDDDAVRGLINAVVEMAVRDYIRALSDRAYAYGKPEVIKRELEGWAQSGYAKFLCDDIDIPSAFARIREKHISFCSIADSHWDDTPDKHGDIYFRCPMCGGQAIIKGRRTIKKGSKERERISIKTARCSCGCEYRREGCF